MSCTVLLEIQVKEECIEQIQKGFKEMLPDTRSYDGCLDIYIAQDKDKPTTFVAVERWESREKYEKYLAWRTERGDLDAIGAMLTAEPSIRYFDPKDA